MHSGKSMFNSRQKSHPKTSLALFSYVQTNEFARYCLRKIFSWCAELGRDVMHHPPGGLSDCAQSLVLWAVSIHFSLPRLNDVPGTLQAVEMEFLAKLGLILALVLHKLWVKHLCSRREPLKEEDIPRKLEPFKTRPGSLQTKKPEVVRNATEKKKKRNEINN